MDILSDSGHLDRPLLSGTAEHVVVKIVHHVSPVEASCASRLYMTCELVCPCFGGVQTSMKRPYTNSNQHRKKKQTHVKFNTKTAHRVDLQGFGLLGVSCMNPRFKGRRWTIQPTCAAMGVIRVRSWKTGAVVHQVAWRNLK